jgi:hypothetical protein
MTGKMTTEVFIASAFTGYFVKLIIAIALTPLIYLGHSIIEKYLHNEYIDENQDVVFVKRLYKEYHDQEWNSRL